MVQRAFAFRGRIRKACAVLLDRKSASLALAAVASIAAAARQSNAALTMVPTPQPMILGPLDLVISFASTPRRIVVRERHAPLCDQD